MKLYKINPLIPLILSLFIHLLFVVFFMVFSPSKKAFFLGGGEGSKRGNQLFGSNGRGGLPGEDEKFSDFIKPKELFIEIKEYKPKPLVSKIESDEKGKTALTKNSEDGTIVPESECEDKKSFGGIGVKFNTDVKDLKYPGLLVEKAPEYYPAYKAGIRPGDILYGDISSIRGEVNKNIKVQVYRNGEFKEFSIKRTKICYTQSELNIKK